MKLFDEQLAPRLAQQLNETFPGSAHVHELELGQADDRLIWSYARDHEFVIVTKDADFADLTTAWGHPPKVIWIRIGNCATSAIEELLRAESEAVMQLGADSDLGTLVIG